MVSGGHELSRLQYPLWRFISSHSQKVGVNVKGKESRSFAKKMLFLESSWEIQCLKANLRDSQCFCWKFALRTVCWSRYYRCAWEIDVHYLVFIFLVKFCFIPSFSLPYTLCLKCKSLVHNKARFYLSLPPPCATHFMWRMSSFICSCIDKFCFVGYAFCIESLLIACPPPPPPSPLPHPRLLQVDNFSKYIPKARGVGGLQ